MVNWIQLRSGGGYDFDTKTIVGRYSMEKDVAEPLAALPRYVKHTLSPWQVAIHSVAVARTIERITLDLDKAAAGLMHDGHESVIGDIPTPVAYAIDYAKVEAIKEEVQLAMEQELGIPILLTPLQHKAIIKLGDSAALHVEKQLFMVPEFQPWNIKAPPTVWCQTMHDVVIEILNDHENYDGGKGAFIYEYNRLITSRTV